MKKSLVWAGAFAALQGAAALEPAALFNDNMVLQREKKVAVWGKATAGNEVKVSFADQTMTTVVAADGTWRVDLEPMTADAEGKTLALTESEPGWFGSTVDEKAYTNVVVGEVWLCGGQSNMTFAMWPAPNVGQHAGRERNGYYDIMLTDEPDVRGVRMYECWSAQPKAHDRLQWFAFTPGNGGTFSGAAWHYAMRLYRSLRIPVGVIECAWGGTCIETWIPAHAYAASKSFKDLATRPIRTEPTAAEVQEAKKRGRSPSLHQQARACWNAMIYPLAPYTLRGAIWYQGCSNRGRWGQYYEMLETLRKGWSDDFECPDLPFFFCQIAPYGYTTEERDDGSTQIREEMARFAANYAPNVGMAILSDVGELDNIHPGDKRTVGTRLAALALNRLYGFRQVKCDAPVLDKVERSADGKKIVLSFQNVENWCRNGTYRPAFELAGADGKYVTVESQTIAKSNRIELTIPAGLKPTRVAYMRKSCVHGFIKNEAGLPIGPFRADVP